MELYSLVISLIILLKKKLLRGRNHESERLSTFPDVTQQTYRQGRDQVGWSVLITCRALGKLKGKVISGCKIQARGCAQGVSLGQPLTAFMRLWNVSIERAPTVWEARTEPCPLGSLPQLAPGHPQSREKRQTLPSQGVRRAQDFKGRGSRGRAADGRPRAVSHPWARLLEGLAVRADTQGAGPRSPTAGLGRETPGARPDGRGEETRISKPTSGKGSGTFGGTEQRRTPRKPQRWSPEVSLHGQTATRNHISCPSERAEVHSRRSGPGSPQVPGSGILLGKAD